MPESLTVFQTSALPGLLLLALCLRGVLPWLVEHLEQEQ